jgi:hypothetical protein
MDPDSAFLIADQEGQEGDRLRGRRAIFTVPEERADDHAPVVFRRPGRAGTRLEALMGERAVDLADSATGGA